MADTFRGRVSAALALSRDQRSSVARQLKTTVIEPVPDRSGTSARKRCWSGAASIATTSEVRRATSDGVPAVNVAPALTSTRQSERPSSPKKNSPRPSRRHADLRPVRGERRGVRDRPRTGAHRVDRLGQAEVEDLDGAVRPHLDVRGLQIAVDDPLLVRSFERLRDLLRDGQGFVERQGAARHELRRRHAFHAGEACGSR